jgi:hypothetical protein
VAEEDEEEVVSAAVGLKWRSPAPAGVLRDRLGRGVRDDRCNAR